MRAALARGRLHRLVRLRVSRGETSELTDLVLYDSDHNILVIFKRASKTLDISNEA